MTFEEHYSNLSYAQKMQVHEVNARGTYLSISCDYERVMDDIISLCQIEKVFSSGFANLNDEEINNALKDYQTRLIIWLEMGKKFNLCKRLLGEYNNEYFESFSKYFVIISDLVQDRNLMAHGYSDYDIAQEKGKILILFENVEKGKRIKKVIEVKSYLQKLSTYREGIMELANLALQLRKEIFSERHFT